MSTLIFQLFHRINFFTHQNNSLVSSPLYWKFPWISNQVLDILSVLYLKQWVAERKWKYIYPLFLFCFIDFVATSGSTHVLLLSLCSGIMPGSTQGTCTLPVMEQGSVASWKMMPLYPGIISPGLSFLSLSVSLVIASFYLSHNPSVQVTLSLLFLWNLCKDVLSNKELAKYVFLFQLGNVFIGWYEDIQEQLRESIRELFCFTFHS